MSRTSITMVVLVLLCAAGFAYSQGWFSWRSSGSEVKSNAVGTEQMVDEENMKDAAAPATQQTK